MGYTVSALPNYTNEPVEKLIMNKLFDEIPTLKYCETQTGIKSAETINIISTDPVWQEVACNFSASGTTTFTQRTITVGKRRINMKWCEDDLEPKYTQKALKKGSEYTSLTFNTEIVSDTLQNVNKKMETALWQGDTASWNTALNAADGFVKIINAATIGGTLSGTTWSKANSRTVMTGLADLVAADVDVWRDGNTNVKFFMNPTMVHQYRMKLVSDNLYHITGEESKLYVEGTNIEIVAVPGLAGLNYIYAIEPENMYFGTDLENEWEKFKVWYSQDNDEIRFKAKWKYGVQVAFPLRIYKYLGV